MAYGKISKNNELIYAPRNLLRADGELITGFSTNVELMKQYGYKEIIEYPIDYDKNLEITYVSKLEEDSTYIYVYYDKKLKDTCGTSTDIDPYNYYTKKQTYSKENIEAQSVNDTHHELSSSTATYGNNSSIRPTIKERNKVSIL